jgi:hypothetical protein
MKQLLLTAVLSVMITLLTAQTKDYIGLAGYNTQNAMPFGKFVGMFKEQFHPGIEAIYGRNISQKKNHDWFLELRLSYFFHRYVQHAIPVYLDFGYRYKINDKFSAETSIGAGYMHSIPATAKLKLNEEGDYENNKGIGRAQIMATYSLGFGYTLHPKSAKSLTAFVNYQQRVQTPFINSYVPVLPYSSFMIGVRKPITKRSNDHKS